MRYILLFLVSFLVFSCENSATYHDSEKSQEREVDSLSIYSSGDSSVVLRYSDVEGFTATLDYRFVLDPVVFQTQSGYLFYRPKVIYCHYNDENIKSVRCTLLVVDSSTTLCSYGIDSTIWAEMVKCDAVGIIQNGIRPEGDLLESLNKKNNKTIILVTHNSELCKKADRAINIAAGQIN